MGRCYKCKKPILYNSFKVVKGVVYCLKCKPEKRISKKINVISSAKLDFDEFQSAMKDVALIVVDEQTEPEFEMNGESVDEIKETVDRVLEKTFGTPAKLTIEKKPKKKRSKKKTKKVN